MKLLLLTLGSCAIGRQGVYFDEMAARPAFKIENNILTIKTSNSRRNSALLIYKVNVSVDKNKKEVYLSADQAAGKSYKDIFIIKLAGYKIFEPSAYSFYWRDPDNKSTKLDVILEN